jgi:hypothetical protein
MKRLLLVAVAAVLVGTWATPAMADTQNVYLTDTQYTATTSTGACVGYVMSVSDAPDVTMFLQNYQTGSTCTGWLEQSGNGSTWSPLSYPSSLPSLTGSYSWSKTINFPLHGSYVRVCVVIGAGTAGCSPAATPAGGGGFAGQDAYPLMYTTGLTSQASSSGACGAALSATSVRKPAALASAVMYNLSAGVTCSAWLESSWDGGTTWRTVSPVHALPSVTGGEAIGFTSLYPDGDGELARACVQLAGTASPECTTAW